MGTRPPQGSASAGRGPVRRRAGPAIVTRALMRLTLVAALVGAGGAMAQQSPMQSLESLPARPPVNPDVDPYPFDPFLSLRSYLRQRLPAGWWTRDPSYEAGAFVVVVHIPESWRGNPTSAMLRLCPEPSSMLWERIQVVELRPFYHQAPWPAATCRR
ncbi:hypothetical protein V5F55_00215 [Xanthobacter sp. V3C-4]|uniref:hypothetical protein n=2 Tax=Xanthobacter autotrophicus (strain ATCC BAA-1158 / Py2) TaxID=78245 RepID=UPI00372BE614